MNLEPARTVTVRIKNVYGVEKVYPACPQAKLFTDISGTATLRPNDIKAIKMLGYGVVVEQQTIGT
jgi:hypothetical protein